MLLKLKGSSRSGKTTLAAVAVAHLSDGIVVHDFDEIGVPSKFPRGGRSQANEAWVRRAIDYQRQGLDLLTGQSPLGETLATPSA